VNNKSHVGFWVIVFAVSFFVTPYFFREDAMRARLAEDITETQNVFGPVLGPAVISVSTSFYRMTVGNTGVNEAIQQLQHSKKDMELARFVGSTIMESAAVQVDSYMAALGMEFYLVVFRMAIVGMWLLLLLPLAMAVIVDGLSARSKKFETLGFQNPTAFSMSFHIAVLMTVVPGWYIFHPFPISPIFMPYWACLAALPFSFALTHTQPILTR
jgi:Domain of unknown function (DUF4400)